MKRKILVASSSRAERSLLEPIIHRLKNHSEVDFLLFEFKSEEPVSEVLEAFQVVLDTFKPQIVAIPTDRAEMVPLTWLAFSKNIVVAHVLHSGDIGSNVQDEAYRWAISRLSHIMFTNSWESAWNLIHAGEEEYRIYYVGSTAFDDVELDESIVPNHPFDILLVNPDTNSEAKTLLDIQIALSKIDKPTIIFYPNEDHHRNIIIATIEKHRSCYGIKIFEVLPRNQYLALLKHCKRAIGNSSSFTFELPFLNPNVEHVQIGERNKNRQSLTELRKGASERIVQTLVNLKIDEKLLRKKLTYK